MKADRARLSLVTDEPPQDILRTSGHSVHVPGVLPHVVDVRRIPVDEFEIESLRVMASSLRALGITPATCEVLDRFVTRWEQAA